MLHHGSHVPSSRITTKTPTEVEVGVLLHREIMEKNKIEELLEHVREWGCSCDIMNNYSCGHLKILQELREALNGNNSTTP